MTVTVSLDRDLEVRVKKFADGVGVEMSELVERALVYALSSRYPDNSLPGGAPARPDQGLPGDQPEIDNGLPDGAFDPSIDNELPDGEIPVDPGFGGGIPAGGGRPDQGLPGAPGHPDQGLPPSGGHPSQGQGLNPDLDPNLDPNLDKRQQPKR